ncbi:MAG TPA: nicotinate-nucleotide diphosphorylase (carboxylating), partial [Holophaga sp.]|nr:nicotinate-nucleotide diphosphorylase (carboxylating) [Holophaga sp.]
MFHPPHPLTYRAALEAFLKEDWSTQDWTTAAVPDRPMQARVVAKADLVVAGLPVAREVFRLVDPELRLEAAAEDGQSLSKGQVAFELSGSSRAILLGERVMLNLLQRLSGTATLTKAFVDAV